MKFSRIFRKVRYGFFGNFPEGALRILRESSKLFVGVDAHIDPAECTVFTEIFGKFDGTQRGDVLNRPLRRAGGFSGYVDSSMRKSLLAFSLVALPISSGASPRSCAIFAATKGTSDGSLRRPR